MKSEAAVSLGAFRDDLVRHTANRIKIRAIRNSKTGGVLVYLDADEIMVVPALSPTACRMNDPAAIVGTYRRSATIGEIANDLRSTLAQAGGSA